MRIIVFSLLLLFTSFSSILAQDLKIPQPSTLQRIEQDFGLGQISVTYSRPNAKGRKVFDGMEPYGSVWRTGANFATKVKLTDTFNVEGHTLPPGEYGFFTIPGAKEWTVIFNTVAVQWGAYSYDSTKDVLRFKVKPFTTDKKVESFTMQFINTTVDNTELQLAWDNTGIAIHWQTDVDARVMANIDKAMQQEKKPYYFAAIYYYNHNKDMNKALAWINEFDKAQPNADNAKYWKSRILLKKGDKQAAIAVAKEGIKLATESSDAEYLRLNKEALAEATK